MIACEARHLLIVGCQERYRLAHGKASLVFSLSEASSSKRNTFIGLILVQIKVRMAMMYVSLCHLGSCNREPVLVGIWRLHSQEVAE